MNDRTFSDFVTQHADAGTLISEAIGEGAGERDYERLQELLGDFFFQRPGAARDKAAALIGHKVAALVQEYWEGSHALEIFERDRDCEPCAIDAFKQQREYAAL